VEKNFVQFIIPLLKLNVEKDVLWPHRVVDVENKEK